MSKVQIHVNRQLIAYNRKNNTLLPVFTVKAKSKNTYADSVQINGSCKLVYRPSDPLSCGAVAFIEADEDDLVLENPMKYAEVAELMTAGKILEALLV